VAISCDVVGYTDILPIHLLLRHSGEDTAPYPLSWLSLSGFSQGQHWPISDLLAPTPSARLFLLNLEIVKKFI
jgi:hypothetical protein